MRRLTPLLIVAVLLPASCSTDREPDSSATDRAAATSVASDASDATDDPGTGDGTADPTSATTPSVGSVTGPEPEPPLILQPTVVSAPEAPMVAVVSVVVRDPVQLEATATSGDHVVEVPRTTSAAPGPRTLPVVGLRAGRTYDIAVRALTGGVTVAAEFEVQFTVPPLPDWIPAHTVDVLDASRVSPGYTVIETRPEPDSALGDRYMLLAYDEAGEVVWYWVASGGVAAFEQTVAGTFLTNYWPFGIRESNVLGEIIHDWQPEVEFAEGETAPDAVPERDPNEPAVTSVTADWIELRTFHHENWPLDDGNVLALSTTLHELTPEQRGRFCPGDPNEFDVISDVVVEFAPDGTVVRTWDVWDAIDIDEYPGSHMCEDPGMFASNSARDWTHANAVVYDERRDAIIVSLRHTDQVIAFDHVDGDGPQHQVRWILGAGATMPLDGEPTYHQHATEVLADGTIIIYDNGNARPGTGPGAGPPYSRAVIYAIDDSSPDRADWSASQVWQHIAFDDGGAPVFTAFIGDADPLANGNVLITHGGIGVFPPTDDSPMGALVIEVVPSGADGGEIVWRLTTDPSAQYTVYRAERLESFYVGPDWEH